MIMVKWLVGLFGNDMTDKEQKIQKALGLIKWVVVFIFSKSISGPVIERREVVIPDARSANEAAAIACTRGLWKYRYLHVHGITTVSIMTPKEGIPSKDAYYL